MSFTEYRVHMLGGPPFIFSWSGSNKDVDFYNQNISGKKCRLGC